MVKGQFICILSQMPFEFRQFEISFMVAAACILLHDYIFDDTIEEVTDDSGV